MPNLEPKDIERVLTAHKGENRIHDIMEEALKPFVIIDPRQKAKEIHELVYGPRPAPQVSPDIKKAEYEAFEKALVALWNEMAKRHPNVTAVLKISDERRKAIKTRFGNQHFRDNIRDVIAKIEGSRFLLGTNDRNWVINFDFIVKNDSNYVKILEGRYAEHKKSVLEQYMD